MEQWKPLPGYESHYSISSLGRLMRTRLYQSKRPDRPASQGKIHTPRRMTSGYIGYCLCVDGKVTQHLAHRLVASAFIGPCPDGKEVNHKNAVRDDNRSENLEYVTRSENLRLTHLRNRKPTSLRGSMVNTTKLCPDKVRHIRVMASSGATKASIARHFKVGESAVRSIIFGQSWKWVT